MIKNHVALPIDKFQNIASYFINKDENNTQLRFHVETFYFLRFLFLQPSLANMYSRQ